MAAGVKPQCLSILINISIGKSVRTFINQSGQKNIKKVAQSEDVTKQSCHTFSLKKFAYKIFSIVLWIFLY